MDDAYETKDSENWPFQIIVQPKTLGADNLTIVSLAKLYEM